MSGSVEDKRPAAEGTRTVQHHHTGSRPHVQGSGRARRVLHSARNRLRTERAMRWRDPVAVLCSLADAPRTPGPVRSSPDSPAPSKIHSIAVPPVRLYPGDQVSGFSKVAGILGCPRRSKGVIRNPQLPRHVLNGHRFVPLAQRPRPRHSALARTPAGRNQWSKMSPRPYILPCPHDIPTPAPAPCPLTTAANTQPRVIG